MAKYGANVAGPIWIAGSVIQLLIGAAATSPRQIASAVCNLLSPATYALFGHKRAGVGVGSVLGIIGTELALHPFLVKGEFGTVFGFSAFLLGSVGGIMSGYLTRRFADDRRLSIRSTIGSPRRIMGLTFFFLCRLPILYTSITHGRGLSYTTPFFVWAIGDLAFSLSRDQDVQPRR